MKNNYPDLLNHLHTRFSEKISECNLSEPDKAATALVDKLRDSFGGLQIYMPKKGDLQFIFDNCKEDDFVFIACKEIIRVFSNTLQHDYSLPSEYADDLSFSLVGILVHDCAGELVYIPMGKKMNVAEKRKKIYAGFLKGLPLWELANQFGMSLQRVYGIIKIERKNERLGRSEKLGTL